MIKQTGEVKAKCNEHPFGKLHDQLEKLNNEGLNTNFCFGVVRENIIKSFDCNLKYRYICQKGYYLIKWNFLNNLKNIKK